MSTNKVHLTPAEQRAIANFIAAARALPKSICISLNEWGHEDGEPTLEISKRTSSCTAQVVDGLRKKSLIF